MNLEKTDSVIEGNNLEAIKRHKNTPLRPAPRKVTTSHFETGIGAWKASVDEKLQQADKELGKVHDCLRKGKEKR